MDATEAFKVALRQYGQPLTPDHIHPDTAPGFNEFLHFFRDIMARNKKLAAGDVHCDWVENLSFNALATSHKEYEIIGVFAGVPLLIYNHFYCFLSDPSVLQHIGNAKDEMSDERAIGGLRSGQLSPLPRGPRDPVRHDAAMHLAWNAVMFVFFHELAHIVGCHLRLLSESLGTADYLELPVTPVSSSEARMRLLLELEADQAAASNLSLTWYSMWDRGAFEALNPVGPDVSWAISLAMLFVVMDGLQPAYLQLGQSTHPSPLARMTHIITLAANRRLPHCLDEDTVLCALNEVTRWRHKLGLRPSSGDHGLTMQVHDDLNALRLELAETYSDRLGQYRAERRQRRGVQRARG